MSGGADRSFEEFVAARSTALLRTAYLLTGDSGHAEDLLKTALIKAYLHWWRFDRDDAERDAALADRLARELPAHAADVTADPAETAELAVDGVRSRRHHRAGLLAVLAFLVLVALLVALTV